MGNIRLESLSLKTENFYTNICQSKLTLIEYFRLEEGCFEYGIQRKCTYIWGNYIQLNQILTTIISPKMSKKLRGGGL